MPDREQRITLGLAALFAAALMLAAVTGHPGLLAYAAPFAVLILPLLAGRYLGEDRVAELRASPRVRQLRPRRSAGARTTGFAPLLPRGGRLMARGLAVRPPPSLVTS